MKYNVHKLFPPINAINIHPVWLIDEYSQTGYEKKYILLRSLVELLTKLKSQHCRFHFVSAHLRIVV
jgi:hypothetical protein